MLFDVMEKSRITPRLRPRPYDLRRKVLLKNFFREQMTYIPQTHDTVETSLDVNSDSNSDENESNSNIIEGNILTPKEVHDNILTPVSVPEPAPSTSNFSEKENANNPRSSFDTETSSNISKAEEKPAKFSRFSRIIETIDSRLSTRKNKRKGITKAKHELRINNSILKPTIRKIIKDTEGPSKIKSKSFFERFKSRRAKKRNKSTTSKISNLFGSSNPSPSKCNFKVASTSTQSVQTDVSWSPDLYEKMEQSNKSLLEENRLLSESLSNIITNADIRSGSLQNSFCTDSYTSNKNDHSTAYFSNESRTVYGTVNNGRHSRPIDFTRTRVLRSKSMQNRNEKRNPTPSRLRTRSFNGRYAKRSHDSDLFIANEPHYSKQEYYRPNSIETAVPSCTKTKPSGLRSIDAPSLCNTDSSLLKSFLNKPSKAIIRRSSMPERTYSYKAHPVRSSSMRENNRYSYISETESSRSTRSSRRRKSTTYNGYSGAVPFLDLPAEAFY